MLTRYSRRALVLYALLFILLTAAASLSAYLVISGTLGKSGGLDFHANWYHAHSLRQGKNPFLAQGVGDPPTPPVRYLDGVVQTGEIRVPSLAYWSTITAPLLLLAAPLAYLSWPTAKVVWMILLLILAIWTPVLIIRLFPSGSFPTAIVILLCLLFYSFRGVRALVSNGQMSMPVIFLMICALLTVERRWWLAGLLLGIALSKYSVSLPVFLLLLYQGHLRALAVSLAVQLAGLLAVSLPFGTSPLATLATYVWILRGASRQPGIQAAALSPLPGDLSNIAVALLGTALVFAMIWHPALQLRRTTNPLMSLPNLHLFTILILWTLLVAYHRIYEVTLVFVFVVLIVHGLIHRDVWKLSNRMVWIPAATLGFLILTQLGGSPSGGLQFNGAEYSWNTLLNRTTTISLILALGVSIWLYRRLWRLHRADLPGTYVEATPGTVMAGSEANRANG